ncbi:hypothetical protein HQ850_00860 [Enterococcus faecium]|uniref:hypothetical protein n=1 Tax=Enterococcus faecium TaxID=1352 RepID=UPI000A3598FE|nr:hypothetical protein [Enterococcus faecium]EGP4929767.1 hypothetical protein [Enterococcus faecium]EGP4931157.1 hypothetical protein [Enterococcus faecium]EGP5216625.1 hypothetical protein [Enterococcus faecium]EGV6194206.1 hypothetical protein [Enterococcus faecium]EME3246296.1 hypothetical protein [Enterococcus faecium]
MGRKKVVHENGKSYVVVEKKPIYKRVWFWILAVIVFFVIVGLIGGTTKKDEAAEPATASSSKSNAANLDEKEKTESSTKDVFTLGDSISEPAVVGDTFSFALNDYSDETIGIKVNGIHNSVNGISIQDILTNENQFNPVANDGWQWLGVHVSILYLAEDLDDENASQNIMIDPRVIVDKKLLSRDSVVEPEGMENTFELYNKTTVDKLIPILVPTDLNGHDVLLRFNGFLGEDYRYLKISDPQPLTE